MEDERVTDEQLERMFQTNYEEELARDRRIQQEYEQNAQDLLKSDMRADRLFLAIAGVALVAWVTGVSWLFHRG